MENNIYLKFKIYQVFSLLETAWAYFQSKTLERHSLHSCQEIMIKGDKQVINGHAKGGLVVFAATIGEFQAARPFINAYLSHFQNSSLTLIPGQTQYIEAFGKAFPEAIIALPPQSNLLIAQQLLRALAPRLVVIAEGPSLYCRFPIPLDLPLAAACLASSIPLVVINSCLYEPNFPGRMDRLKNWLFRSLYIAAIKHWYAPADLFRDMLINEGIPKDHIDVVGDLKFDSIFGTDLPPKTDSLLELLELLKNSKGPLIIAGSVNASDEQASVIDAWLQVKAILPSARLILAPRYINNPEVLAALDRLFNERSVVYARRSAGMEACRIAPAIVIDVFGELPHLYALADVAYVGRNHGVLEPVRYAVPTVVAPDSDWRKDYAAYPLYRLMCTKEGILSLNDKREMGATFIRLLQDPTFRTSLIQRANHIASENRGGSERALNHILEHILLEPQS